MAYFLLFPNQKKPILSYSEEIINIEKPVYWQEGDTEISELVNALCVANPLACSYPEFKAKQKELDYLNEKKSEILNRLNSYDQNTDLQILLTKIELEKNEIVKQMISKANIEMKKLINIIALISIVLIRISVSNAIAQTTVQVVTKTIDGNEKWTAGMKLEVVGENAVIYCESHPGNSISYEIQIIAKHADKEQAKLDLKKMKWISGKQGKTLFMRNYIELASGDARPESMLKVIYHIKIPETCPLTINNYFGGNHCRKNTKKNNAQIIK